MKKKIVLAALFLTALLAQAATIGQWNIYPAYSVITDIEPAGNIIYVLSSKNLFSYNVHDESVQTYGKKHGLSDADISFINWNPKAKRLMVVYSNYNIDLIDNDGNCENLSDYYSKSTSLDKTINRVKVFDQYAYLCTSFGLVKVNVQKGEITDTYNIGQNIDDMTLVNNTIYAAVKSSNRVFQGSVNDNLLDKINWTLYDGAKKDLPFAIEGKKITTSSVVVYDNTNQCYWSNDADGNLQAYTLNDDNEQTIIRSGIHPDGPSSNYFYSMKVFNNKLYGVPGGWSYIDKFFRTGYVQILDEEGNWTVYGKDIKPTFGNNFQDVSSIAVDPKDPNHFFIGTGGTGIYEFLNGEMVNNFTHGNSEGTIQSTIIRTVNGQTVANQNYVRADGVWFDADGNLWFVNSNSINPVIEFTADRQWVTYNNEEMMNTGSGKGYNMLTRSYFDSKRRLWFVNDIGTYPALFCFDTVNKTAKQFNDFKNQDGTTFTIYRVPNVGEDKSGNIWLCTEIGPLMLTEEQIADPSLGFTQVKVPRNDGTNLADYLLNGLFITCMTTDGAGRKWFGTGNDGVYLISEDNNTQVYHFTETNSNLLSNNIESITVNDKTGEVFFGTNKGLCSFMSDATETAEVMTSDQVYAYPNPVRPDYTGLITITGLTYQADVKILTANGTLVKEGRSTGGSFTWDGTDMKGKRVASGVYMVNTATNEGKKGTVCKIAIIR